MRNAFIDRLMEWWTTATERLNAVGQQLPPLLLRLILGWEFWEAGVEKLRGENWFTQVHDQFPAPFNWVSADLSWTMATGAELGGALLLWLGLATRFTAFSLLILTAVATATVHWPSSWDSLTQLWQGYAISDDGFGNFKLPLLFMVMLLPLLFNGAGRWSLDHALARFGGLSIHDSNGGNDVLAWSFGVALLSIPLLFLIPAWGLFGLLTACVLLVTHRFVQRR